MPDDARTRYLAELDALLPMPVDGRAEILEEIAAHLDDAVADRLERGEPLDRAEPDAQARLGAPRELARELARPEQRAWRVFAGVGAAIRGGIGHWIYGYLLGLLLIVAGTLGLTAIVQAAGRLLGTGWSLQYTDQGWNTMLSALAAGMGLYFAGRVIPDRFGRASRRLAVDVRPSAIGVSLLAVLALTTLAIDAPQNWASVAALTLAPIGLVVGAYRPELLPARVRLSAIAIVVGLLMAGILGVSLAGASSSSGSQVISGFPDRGLSMVGPEWHPGTDPYSSALASSNVNLAGDVPRWEAELAPAVSLRGFSDLRVEAWRTVDSGMILDPAYHEPFATAPVVRAGRSLSAAIDTTSEPGVTSWDLILTGVADDGERYVIDASTGGQTTFTGSVWDWLVAVTADR